MGDAFVTKLHALGSGLAYSTYLGGGGNDQGNGIAVDSAGHAYVTGFTLSTNFPTTPGAFQTASGGGPDAFVTKLNALGSGLVSSEDWRVGEEGGARGSADHSTKNEYATGVTSSSPAP